MASLNDLLREAHKEAKRKAASNKEEGTYRKAFNSYLVPKIQELFEVDLRQREMDRFEKGLWSTIELWRGSQGFKNTGEFLGVVYRFTEKFMKEKKAGQPD